MKILAKAVVTGGTGFLGSHFLINFVGTFLDCAVLIVRGKDVSTRSTKLRRALEVAGSSYRPERRPELIWDKLRIVEGDLALPGFGLDHGCLAAIGKEAPDEFWHFAATLNFEEYRADQIQALNVDGALEAIELADRLGISKFVYISTAYSCGAQTGDIPETLHDPGRRFLNEYEKSKCLAENAIAKECRSRGMTLTILRPSVVVGNSQTKLPGGSATGLYGMIRELSRMRPVLKRDGRDVRLFGDATGQVNFIPVDHLMEDLQSILDSGRMIRGGIFHLTYDTNPDLGAAFSTLFAELKLRNIRLADSSSDDLSPIEQLIDRRTTFYRGYLYSNKRFARVGNVERHMTLEEFRSYIVEAVRFLDGDENTAPPRMVRVRASDGAELNTFFAPGPAGAPAVLLCNAIGMPMECMRPLMEHLSRSAKVASWECRGLPSPGPDIDEMDVSIDRHAADAADVCEEYGFEQVVLVGWCSGARLAMRIAARFPGLVSGMVLLNGGHIGGTDPSVFERNIAKVMPLIAADRRYAGLFYESIFRHKGPAEAASTESEASDLVTSTLLATDSPQFLHLASRPFQSEESLYAYGRIQAAFLAEQNMDAEFDVRLPTLISTGTADTTVNPRSSWELAKRIPGAQVVELRGRDHFAMYHDRDLLEKVSAFVASIPRDDCVRSAIDPQPFEPV